LKETSRQLITGFVPLARLAGMDVQSHLLGHGGPEEPRTKMTISLLKAKVTRYDRVVGIMKEGKTKVRVSRDTNKKKIIALHTKHPIN
jgi:hypothetical protein